MPYLQLDDLIAVWELNSGILMKISADLCGTLQHLAAEQQEQMEQMQQVHLMQTMQQKEKQRLGGSTAVGGSRAELLSKVLSVEAMGRSEAQSKILTKYSVGAIKSVSHFHSYTT